MQTYSTREAAAKLGITLLTLQRYIATKRIRPPKLKRLGKVTARIWSSRDIERVRKQIQNLKPIDGRRKENKQKKRKKSKKARKKK